VTTATLAADRRSTPVLRRLAVASEPYLYSAPALILIITVMLVPLALGILWLRLSLQICGYLRMIAHPDAEPIAVPKLITLETQVKDEIAEALGREEQR